MKKLKPSNRINFRYLLLDAKSREQVEKIVLDYLGILGWAKANPRFVNSGKIKNIILAINRKEIDNVRAAFEICTENIKVLKVSGTLKGLER